MIDWNDVRYFLAVANEGSAAERLEVDHYTVLRRTVQLEGALERKCSRSGPSSYRLTDAAEEIREFAEQIGASSSQLATGVFGRYQSVRERFAGIERVKTGEEAASQAFQALKQSLRLLSRP